MWSVHTFSERAGYGRIYRGRHHRCESGLRLLLSREHSGGVMGTLCDVCRKSTYGVTIFNAMSGSPPERWVRACPACADESPCACSGWVNGLLVCTHGRRWRLRASWDWERTRATVRWDLVESTWWARWFGWLFRCSGKTRFRRRKPSDS